MKFRLEFRLATQHMKDNKPIMSEIASTLGENADMIFFSEQSYGNVKDEGGNTIGEYEIIREDDE
jgi:phage gpG-like protein